jgi:glycosidase
LERLVWTTFSADQVDLNFGSLQLLLDILETLLFYVGHGAEFIRLDAIAYMWKEIGTNCLHLPQTHRLIQLMRRLLDRAAPRVALITETNVPHEDNISYFGDGRNEAQMVYNFTLPPLTLHAFHSGSATALSRWAETLTLPSDETTFFNFLASHDGIGLTPLRGILSDTEIIALAQRVEALGGRVSSRSNADGSTSPYELNINYLDALGDPREDGQAFELIARRFLASQAIMLALRGVPGIYFHSLFGSRGWLAGVQETGRARTINREKLQRSTLEAELADTGSLRHRIFHGYRHLLERRQATPAFHPNADQQVLFVHAAVFSLLRSAPASNSHVICLHNVSDQSQDISIDLADLPIDGNARFVDLVGESTYQASAGQMVITITPYQVLWLQLR